MKKAQRFCFVCQFIFEILDMPESVENGNDFGKKLPLMSFKSLTYGE